MVGKEFINFSPGDLSMGSLGSNIGVSVEMKIHSAGWFLLCSTFWFFKLFPFCF